MPKAHQAVVHTPVNRAEKVGDKYLICGHCIGAGDSVEGCNVTVIEVDEETKCEICGFTFAKMDTIT